MILVLFSGGVESTVLLKYFLKETKLLVHVLYTKLGYDDYLKLRIPEQEKSSNNILNYFKKNYRGFNYSSLELKLDNINVIHVIRIREAPPKATSLVLIAILYDSKE